MIKYVKDNYYYKKYTVDQLFKLIKNDSYIDLFMRNTSYEIIKNEKENFIFLKNKYAALRFTFAESLNSPQNKIIDIR